MFITLEGPEQLTFDDGRRIRHIDDYVRWHAHNLNPTARGDRFHSPMPVVVEHGRWLVHCICGCGMLTRPEMPIACCIWCGNIYDRLTFPENWRTIERVLLQRPRREQQNWLGETVDELLEENREHLGVV